MPSSSIMHSSATTVGCDSGGDRSVASARPTVCVVCSPAPTSRNASAAAACPTQGAALLSPDSRISANGMIASPPNCTMVPIHRYGTRRQPRTERWVSDFQPTTARSGANSSGREIIVATSQAGTPSSTIITRFRVPISSTTAMPTVT